MCIFRAGHQKRVREREKTLLFSFQIYRCNLGFWRTISCCFIIPNIYCMCVYYVRTHTPFHLRICVHSLSLSFYVFVLFLFSAYTFLRLELLEIVSWHCIPLNYFSNTFSLSHSKKWEKKRTKNVAKRKRQKKGPKDLFVWQKSAESMLVEAGRQAAKGKK